MTKDIIIFLAEGHYAYLDNIPLDEAEEIEEVLRSQMRAYAIDQEINIVKVQNAVFYNSAMIGFCINDAEGADDSLPDKYQQFGSQN